MTTASGAARRPIIDRLQPVDKGWGFRMDGYFVWCASVVRVDDTHHMFASRWPLSTGDPSDPIRHISAYRHHSEIIRATSEAPEGPYEFQEVVLTGRGEGHWDGMGAHNPYIVRSGDTFVLYYSATFPDDRERGIGYAAAASVEGPWQRCDDPLPVGEDCVNPAAWIEPDGRVLLAFRQARGMKLGIAKADGYDGTYEVVSRWITPGIDLEDPFVMFHEGRYHIIAEDHGSHITGSHRHGAHLVSEDGLTWRPHDPPKVYTHTVEWTDGARTTFVRRERPFLLLENDQITHLITGVLVDDETWSLVQPLAE